MQNISKSFLSSEERKSFIRSHKLEKDGRKRDRLKFILLFDDGWNYTQISEALFLDDQTLRNYWKEYKSGGINSLLSFYYKGRPCKLSEQEYKELELHLSENTYLNSYQIKKYNQNS